MLPLRDSRTIHSYPSPPLSIYSRTSRSTFPWSTLLSARRNNPCSWYLLKTLTSRGWMANLSMCRSSSAWKRCTRSCFPTSVRTLRIWCTSQKSVSSARKTLNYCCDINISMWRKKTRYSKPFPSGLKVRRLCLSALSTRTCLRPLSTWCRAQMLITSAPMGAAIWRLIYKQHHRWRANKSLRQQWTL